MDNKAINNEMWTAIEAGDRETVARMIGADKRILQMTTPFGTWLHYAAQHGALEIIKLLLELGENINVKGGIAGGSALHLAASDGHLEVVRYLLARGAEMDVSEPERNPLFGAIHFGHTAIAKLLIEYGINTKVKYTGKTMKDMDALAFAREWGRTDIAELLKAKP